MKVKSRHEAWSKADALFPTDYMKDELSSANAGYDIFRSTMAGLNAWISDLGDRLEINLENGETVNIWIEEDPEIAECLLAAALAVIDDAIYHIDDDVHPNVQRATGIDEARTRLYEAYAAIAGILRRQHPRSQLFERYNLNEA